MPASPPLLQVNLRRRSRVSRLAESVHGWYMAKDSAATCGREEFGLIGFAHIVRIVPPPPEVDSVIAYSFGHTWIEVTKFVKLVFRSSNPGG